MPKPVLMLLDDERVNEFILRKQCIKIGLEVDIFQAINVGEAIDALNELNSKNFFPLIIFCDLDLDDVMNGYDFLDYYYEEWYNNKLGESNIWVYTSSVSKNDKLKVKKDYPWVKGFLEKGSFKTLLNNLKDLKINLV